MFPKNSFKPFKPCSVNSGSFYIKKIFSNYQKRPCFLHLVCIVTGGKGDSRQIPLIIKPIIITEEPPSPTSTTHNDQVRLSREETNHWSIQKWRHKFLHAYGRPSLFAVLVSAVLFIRGPKKETFYCIFPCYLRF